MDNSGYTDQAKALVKSFDFHTDKFNETRLWEKYGGLRGST